MIGHGSSQSGLIGRWQRITPRKSHPQQHAYSLGPYSLGRSPLGPCCDPITGPQNAK